MKTLLLALLILVSTTAYADLTHQRIEHSKSYRYAHHGHWEQRPHKNGNGSEWRWVVPITIGGVIVYEATRNPPKEVVVYQQTVITEPNCSPWTEVKNPDGSITRTRTCTK